MSGVCGLVWLNGRSAQANDIGPMIQAMHYRGTSSSEACLTGPAALGYRALRSTTQSLHEVLPWHDPGNQLLITADARLDNRRDLILELGDLIPSNFRMASAS